VLRLTENRRAVAEIAAVAEHVASLTAAAAALQLRPDVPTARRDGVGEAGGLLPLVDEDHADQAGETLAAIRDWVRGALGIDHVPAVWRALAHDPRLLIATWRKDRLVLEAGVLDELAKGCAALAVAQFRQSEYWIAYLTQYLRTRCGLDTRALLEIVGAIMHYVSFNTIAHGMRLEAPCSDIDAADVAPGGRFEHLVPGAKRPVRSSPGA
jgi:hypothetical protein